MELVGRLLDVVLVADERDPEALPQEPTEPPGQQVRHRARRLLFVAVVPVAEKKLMIC